MAHVLTVGPERVESALLIALLRDAEDKTFPGPDEASQDSQPGASSSTHTLGGGQSSSCALIIVNSRLFFRSISITLTLASTKYISRELRTLTFSCNNIPCLTLVQPAATSPVKTCLAALDPDLLMQTLPNYQNNHLVIIHTFLASHMAITLQSKLSPWSKIIRR